MCTHDTAPTLFVEAGGVTFAYRRIAVQKDAPAGGSDGPVALAPAAAAAPPLVLLQHLRGSMDYWDPAVVDGLAAGREVVEFDNAGVGLSSGETPSTFAGLADHAADLIRALDLGVVDVLGFSIGGHTAQELVLRHPELVRRLIIAGSKPRGGESEGTAPDVIDVAGRHEVSTLDDFLYLFFSPSAAGQVAGRDFWARRHQRTVDVDAPTSRQTFEAQRDAILDWATPRPAGERDLESITAPTLVVNGSRDIMAPTVNSWVMSQRIPDAQLVIYPDAGHGAIFQYPRTFVAHAVEFLDRHRPALGSAAAGEPLAPTAASASASSAASAAPASTPTEESR
ncbi:alpha/beta hydrolase [Schumannella luteola]|uniref:Pimeloyl-ACP methyl ester carboxylesterase n=1 Tax=Schumannella luteola TaxID=472059 RepID=A0A852Y7X4_9MICO|nr:alpha/beta hydrolase [Schumannella luteola]NYG98473.1 pimeloyl-ACP methyl ester carboxylesterase [Schumannella luteola]TPX01301.1 alpha/beta hydrolase [Schumannella luteola]